MSALNDILDATAAAVGALGLTVGGNALTVAKRKLPKREETVDVAYQAAVYGAEQVDLVKRIAFGSAWKVEYLVEVAVVTPNDHDGLVNLADHAAAREAIRARFMAPTPFGLAVVKRVDVVPSPFLNRSALAEGYDYSTVAFNVTTYETRA